MIGVTSNLYFRTHPELLMMLVNSWITVLFMLRSLVLHFGNMVNGK